MTGTNEELLLGSIIEQLKVLDTTISNIGGGLGAGQGLTENAGNLDLGGTLTQNTTLIGTNKIITFEDVFGFYVQNGEIVTIQGATIATIGVYTKASLIFTTTDTEFRDFYGAKESIKLTGYGEASISDETGVNYSTLVFNSLTPKKYVDDAISNINIYVAVPTTATDTGTAGQIAYDSDYLYICTAANTWKRTSLTTW